MCASLGWLEKEKLRRAEVSARKREHDLQKRRRYLELISEQEFETPNAFDSTESMDVSTELEVANPHPKPMEELKRAAIFIDSKSGGSSRSAVAHIRRFTFQDAEPSDSKDDSKQVPLNANVVDLDDDFKPAVKFRPPPAKRRPPRSSSGSDSDHDHSNTDDELVSKGKFDMVMNDATLEELLQAKESAEVKEDPLPKVYYATRTHKQITQAVRELRSTGYTPKFTVLGSRDHLCINPKVQRATDKNEEWYA